MDFSYIKSAAPCPPGCAGQGEMGPVRQGQDGTPGDVGPDPSVPSAGGPGSSGNPPVTGTGGDGTPGHAISCVAIEIVPVRLTLQDGQRSGFNFKVTYSDGTSNWSYGNGLSGASVVWSSSDDDIVEFTEPTRIGLAPNGYGYVLLAKENGTVTVSIHYSHSSTKGAIGSTASDNWFAACDLTATAEVEVVSTTSVSTPDLETILPFIVDPFATAPPVRVEITPVSAADDGFMEVGDKPWPMQSRVILANGDAVSVTGETAWSSSDPDIATVDANGYVAGVAAGIATITAAYRGFSASTTMEVVPPATVATLNGNTWTARPIDSVIVLDRSASMLIRDEQGLSRVERAKDAALMFLNNADAGSSIVTTSQVAIVSFAGIWLAGATELVAAQTEADATLDQPLTTDRSAILSAIREFKVRGPCALLEGEGTRCATGIGAALLAAQAEVNSDRHEYGHKKMIVLLTDGCENINKPAPAAVALDIKTEGTLICVIALDVTSCSAALEALASPGLYFPSPSAYELSFNFAQIQHFVNYREYGYGFYQ